jgi:hypothetical protein
MNHNTTTSVRQLLAIAALVVPLAVFGSGTPVAAHEGSRGEPGRHGPALVSCNWLTVQANPQVGPQRNSYWQYVEYKYQVVDLQGNVVASTAPAVIAVLVDNRGHFRYWDGYQWDYQSSGALTWSTYVGRGAYNVYTSYRWWNGSTSWTGSDVTVTRYYTNTFGSGTVGTRHCWTAGSL